jgi:hypothetical protein
MSRGANAGETGDAADAKPASMKVEAGFFFSTRAWIGAASSVRVTCEFRRSEYEK